MLQTSDDLLFVLDERERVLECRAKPGLQAASYPIHAPTDIQAVLPFAVRKKCDAALDQLRKSSNFESFECLLVPLPGEANWYEFRLLKDYDNRTFLFIWKSKHYKDLMHTSSNPVLIIEKMVEGWARFLFLRHLETEGHTRRVTNMALRLALRFGLPEGELAFLRYGAELHDIGKILIPDSILLKAGALTKEEWKVMKLHTLAAVRLLKPFREIEPALVIPHWHHERWDGSGYPDGLIGENIPLMARIFALADVYDALTSDRPYRPAWSQAEALRYMQEQSGKHFDPFLAPEFFRMME